MTLERPVSHRKAAKILVAVCFIGLFVVWSIDLNSIQWHPKSPEINVLWTRPSTTTTTNQITLSNDRITVNKNQFSWIDDRNGKIQTVETQPYLPLSHFIRTTTPTTNEVCVRKSLLLVCR